MEKAQKKKQQILAASLRLFNQKGVQNVSTNHIAEELEISVGNLYYHFANKEEIIEQLYSEFNAKNEGFWQRALQKPSLKLFYEALGGLQFLLWDYRFIGLNLNSLLLDSKLRRLHQQAYRQRVEHLNKFVGQLVANGELKCSEKEQEVIVTSFIFISNHWLAAIDARPGEVNRLALREGVMLLHNIIQPYTKGVLNEKTI